MRVIYVAEFFFTYYHRGGRGRRGRAGLNRGRGKRTAPPAAKLLNLNLPPEVVDPWSNAQAGVVLQQQQQHQYPALRTGTWTICNSPLLALARSREPEGIFFGSACVRACGRAGGLGLRFLKVEWCVRACDGVWGVS
jgi:hypothetical protein